MAWNEPGKNDKDPWNNNKGGKNQGPPDLDDLLKDLGNKMGGIFGGKPSGGNSGKSFSSLGLSLILFVAVLVYAFSGFYTIKEALYYGLANTLVWLSLVYVGNGRLSIISCQLMYKQRETYLHLVLC